MTRWRVFALLVLALSAATSAEARTAGELLRGGHVRVRVSTEPARQVLIGQQTRFFVEILTDTWFTKAPAYPELQLEGAIALMPEQLGTNFTERIDGVTFAAQRRSYVIFPQRAGPLEIPALRIRLGVSEGGRAGTPFTVRTRPLRLTVVRPAEAKGIAGMVTTPRLRVRETWSRPFEDLRVGDAVARSVTLEADRALGMLLPDLAFEAPPGIAVYPDQPRVVDRINRGQYRGQRIEGATYVLQRAGEFTLPAIELHWWSPSGSSLRTETLEAKSFDVAAAASTAVLEHAEADPWAFWRARIERAWSVLREHGWRLMLAAIGAGWVWRLARGVLPALLARRRAGRASWRESETYAFRQLERSLRRGDLDDVVGAWWRWRDRRVAATRGNGAAADRDLEGSGLGDAWRRVERQRYGGAAEDVDLRALRTALRSFRAASGQPARREPSALASLNPRSPSS